MRHARKIRFRRAGVSHQVPLGRKQVGDAIDVSDLTELLEIDAEQRTAVAEPGCSFVQVVHETMKHGLVPLVVPELKTITLGGAVSGCSVESMSYKVGGFHDTCLEYEVVTTEGEVLTCSRQDDRALFEMMHGTFGTLACLTKVTFRLVPAEKYVRLTYRRFDGLGAFTAAIEREYREPEHDFMDGLVFDGNSFTLALADFVGTAPYLSDYTGQKVYHRSVRQRDEDYLTTEDYFFRFDRDCHWIARNFGMENPVLRATVGHWLLGSTNMLRLGTKLSRLLRKHPEVTVDTMTSFSRFPRLFEWYDQQIAAYPVWIVPYRMPERYPWINPEFVDTDEDFFIDLATYGVRVPRGKDYYAMIDAELMKLRGIKTLISVNNYDTETFWQIFDKDTYDRAKHRLDPKGKLPDLHTKVHS
ncbi:MAG: FAD-binding oxidoreductase [Micrococcales bacterium]|nr:FAD-binding oxidoreductase [Micrococcales bacterium]MCL2667878.1 FAD-binding oxidoreductase [Micrococcales bacterium]